MMSWSSLSRWSSSLVSWATPVVLLADDLGCQDARGRVERVDGRVDAEAGDVAAEDRRGVEVGEGRGGRRVGEVVGGHVDGLDRRDGAGLGRRDPLLHLAHLRRQRRLVPDGRGHPAQQRRDLRAGLGEPEDVVDEEQHVGAAQVAEVLRQREAGERHARPGAGRLVHLAEHERGLALLQQLHVHLGQVPAALLHRVHEGVAVLHDARLEHLAHEVVPLARPLADAGEDGEPRRGPWRRC